MSLKKRSLMLFSEIEALILRITIIRRFPKRRLIEFINGRGIVILYLTIFLALTAGTVNTLLEGYRVAQSNIPIVPFRSAQTASETVLNFIILVTGLSGVYMTYLSGRQAVRHRVTYMYLIIGLTLILVSLLLGMVILGIKRY